uniref:Uncharacterized protein n=1 Tax=viral metagenome TaxID=1070528 RepID=A0A6M3LUH0_9ZZZZ
MGSTTILERLVNDLKFTALNVNSALTSYDCDDFKYYLKRAEKSIQETLKYIEENEEDVSAVLVKTQVKKAKDKLKDVFMILKEAASAARPPGGYRWLDDFLEGAKRQVWGKG